MQESWNTSPIGKIHQSPDAELLFKNIQDKKASHLQVSRTEANRHSKTWLVAAVLLTLSLLGLWLMKGPVVSEKETLNWSQITAGIGEREYIKLPDGSEVWLNSGSTLAYQEGFESRNIKLSGEAFFQVVRDEKRPFTVTSNGIQTKVLGTSFNIRAYREASNIQVTVKTGKVGVGQDNHQFASITPNQQIAYDKQVQDFTFSEVDAAAVSSWKENKLVFENVTFEEAAITLEKHFGKSIEFDNASLKACRFTSKFDVSEDLDHVLKVLATLNNLQYEVKDNTVLFIGTVCL
ncbi:hypothetical protein GCM10028791_27390 [Echinicola sediminis]